MKVVCVGDAYITPEMMRDGVTLNSYKDAPAFAIRNYLDYLAGQPMKFMVN